MAEAEAPGGPRLRLKPELRALVGSGEGTCTLKELLAAATVDDSDSTSPKDEDDEDELGKDVIGFIAWMQENSVPLLLGVVVALVLANMVPDYYNYYLGGGILNTTNTTGHRLLRESGGDVYTVLCELC